MPLSIKADQALALLKTILDDEECDIMQGSVLSNLYQMLTTVRQTPDSPVYVKVITSLEISELLGEQGVEDTMSNRRAMVAGIPKYDHEITYFYSTIMEDVCHQDLRTGN